MGFWDFLTGSKPKLKQTSTLNKFQQPLAQQLYGAAQGRGSGGAYGTSADYYRDLLSDDNSTFDAFAAPEMRRFNEQIIPGLSEQFAGMGSGALSSSGFRNAAVNAGTDLSERLGSIRANLRQQGAQGLQNIGQSALNPGFNENLYQPGSDGFLGAVAPGVGYAVGSFLGPMGAAAGGSLANMARSSFGGNQQGWMSQNQMKSPNQINPGINLPYGVR